MGSRRRYIITDIAVQHSDNPNECWVWPGHINPDNGYGEYFWGERLTKAHRAVYEALVGPIPEGMNLCHSCDNRPCVNPLHLWPGTQKANMQDCVAKGRINPHNKHKTHCPQGHEYTPENTFHRTANTWPGRTCRACTLESTRRRRARLKKSA